jgi:acetoin utilization deacetylase AcuC-like enzyme
VERALRARGVLRETAKARDATREELLRVHDAAYLDLVERETLSLTTARYLSTGDTVVDNGSLRAALRAAGAAVVAMEAAVERDSTTFSLARPPGHHAEPDRGMGFCIYNNVAVAARAFLSRHGGRVLVVDFDYHHGNGTQAIAGNGLSYVSTHASPAYPGTGSVRETFDLGGSVVSNLPLPVSGIDSERFAQAWVELLPEIAERSDPDLILASAGFDYVRGDPVGDLGVDVWVASDVAQCIAEVAKKHCGGRVAYVLEGGYLVDAIAESISLIAAVADRF